MEKRITISRGLDIKLRGGIDSGTPVGSCVPASVAVVPGDFPGFVPKLAVKEGAEVACGAPLMFDKVNTDIALVSPVAGKVVAVVRGERRKILRVVVEPQGDAAQTVALDDVRTAIMKSGLWAWMRQRPYDIVPTPDATPVNIFVTAFDSAPLAPSLAEAVKGKDAEIKAGVEALSKLTSGSVYVGVREGDVIDVPAPAVRVTFAGPHPAGNAGVQAAAIAPVNKGQTIWTLDIVTLARIGSLMLNGKVDFSTSVAVTGSEVETPAMVNTCVGASLESLLAGRLKTDSSHKRIISGNVLTGATCPADGYLRFPYRQVTVIPEGDDVDEFMGWASMSPSKLSTSRSFLSWLMPGKRFAPDARINGGRRAMIMSGEYDKVMPMDIMPEYLIKAILSRNIDKMEALGIYEVAPEDFALCEFVDPSKLELQKIVRQGLDYLRKELE